MKKLLFVLNNLNIGGPQKSLLALLDELDYDQFDVYLLSLEPNGELEKFINPKVNVLKTPKIYTALTLPSKDTLNYMKYLYEIREFKVLLGFLKAIIRYPFIKSMNPLKQRFWKINSKILPKLPTEFDLAFGVSSGLSTYFIVDCVTSNKKYHWVRGDYSRTVIDKTCDTFYFEKLDGSLSVSSNTKDIFLSMFPFMSDKIHVFDNLLPIKLYSKLDEDTSIMDKYATELKILSIMRLDPDKGLDIAIEAAKKLKDAGIEFVWFVLGDGKQRTVIEDTINKYGLEMNFILLGFKLNTFKFIEKSDLVVHPSKSEGKSNAVEEAKYLNKKIVVTNYATVHDQIEDRVNGLISDMNGESLKNKILEAIDFEFENQILSTQDREKVNIFFNNL